MLVGENYRIVPLPTRCGIAYLASVMLCGGGEQCLVGNVLVMASCVLLG